MDGTLPIIKLKISITERFEHGFVPGFVNTSGGNNNTNFTFVHVPNWACTCIQTPKHPPNLAFATIFKNFLDFTTLQIV